MDRFNIGQLTKEMVVTRLSELLDPCAAAAEIGKKTLLIALENAQIMENEHRQMVVEICAGTMTGMVLTEQNLSRGAVCVLAKAHDCATQLNLDPPEIMELAIRGILRIKKFTTPEQFQSVYLALTREFMGIGEVLERICGETEVLRPDFLARPKSP